MKNFLLAIILLFTAADLFAQEVAGPKDGRNFSNLPITGSDKSWISPQNVSVSDNVFATFGNLSDIKGAYTDYLAVTNFSFNIPAKSRILGIIAYVQNSDPSGATADYSVRIIKNGSLGATEQASGDFYQDVANASNYRTYGSASDVWGERWTPADINASNFGVAVAAQRVVAGVPTAGRIDNIRLSVYYFDSASLPGYLTLPLNLKSFTATPQKDLVRINWTTSDESDMDRFEIQRAAEGKEFVSIGTIFCRNQTATTNYTFTDYSPYSGNSSYRLKILEKSGSAQYSRIATVQMQLDNPNTLYPSPWKRGQGLFIRNPGGERLTIELYDNAGTLLSKQSSTSSQVATESLGKASGVIRYKVYNDKGVQTASGSLMIY
jgi:hypothetical protein